MTLIVLFLFLMMMNASNVFRNISFQISSAQLPASIMNPINAIYGDSLHIISSHSNTIYSTSSFTTNNLLTNKTIDFQTNQSRPDFWSNPISCLDNIKCYDTINESLYIIQPTPSPIPLYDTLYLIIYDMNTQSYRSSSSYQHTINEFLYMSLYDGQFVITCVYSYNDTIYIMGSSYLSTLRGYGYNITSNTWNGPYNYIPFSTLRFGIGCAVYNDWVFLFGGTRVRFGGTRDNTTHIRGSNLYQYGEKCISQPYIYSDGDNDCQFVESMRYVRSDFHISLFLEHYFLIYGGGAGTNDDAMRNMEIFDALNEKFVAVIPNNMDTLNMKQFGSLITNDNILAIIGGQNIDSNKNLTQIEYMDLSDIFTLFMSDEIDDHEPQCWTSYAVDDCRGIDEYLIKDNDRFIFEIYENDDDQSYNIFINSVLEDTYINVKFNRSHDLLEITVEYLMYGAMTFDEIVADMGNVSRSTGIDMTNGYNVMWMKFSPTWSMGFGDVYDKYNINDYGLWLTDDPEYEDCWNKKHTKNKCIPDEVTVVGIEAINICNAIFSFKSAVCSLDLNIENTTFAVGDHLNNIINWNLNQGTSLNIPLFIQSDDIIDFDYIMWIKDTMEGLSQCTLCQRNGNESCIECVDGFLVGDLRTYNKTKNEYKISISSELEALYPKNPIIRLQRVIQEIEFIVNIPSFNDSYDNNTFGIYPNGEIFITPNYNKSKIVQSNGTFTISFDPDLTFIDNVGVIFIDYYKDECMIKYNNITIDCEQPIIIPSSMLFKSIDDNMYGMKISSWDTDITGQTSFEFQRYIQLLSIDVSDTIYLGQVIDTNINILDDEIYQNSSSIILTNEEYNIYSVINIQYDLSNNDIKECLIYNPITGSSQLCEYGLIFRTSTIDIIENYIYLNLTSSDTLIEKNNQNIFVDQCNIGNGIIGNSLTFICDECQTDTVGIIGNSQCIECLDINGITCSGGSNLIISYNYWININNNDNTIISNFCPSGYCCQDMDGCSYYAATAKESISSSLCAANRDVNIALCGGCIEGYSVVIGSTKCKKCTENNYSYLIFPMILAIILVLLLLILDPPPKPLISADKKELNYTKQLLMDDLKAIKFCIFRPILYLSQAINFVTIQNGLFFYLAPLTKILSLDFFDVISNNDEESGICLINGMTSISKQFWYLFFPLSVFLSIGLYAAINLCIKSGLKKQIYFLNFGWNVVMSLFIKLVGNIISTMLKILACSKVNDEFVHFYSGQYKCFGRFWLIALISIISIIILWIIIWFKLYKMDINKRDSRKSALRSITNAYKSKYWYWECSVLLSRRIILSFMVTIQYIDYNFIQYTLLIILIIYLSLHYKYYPFKYNRVNTMESLCIFLIIVALITTIFEFHHLHPNFVSFIMSLIVLLPILLILIYCILIIKHYLKIKNVMISNNVENDLYYKARIKKWESRLTTSQFNVLTAKKQQSIQDVDDNDDIGTTVVEMGELKILKSFQKSIELGSSILNDTSSDNDDDDDDGLHTLHDNVDNDIDECHSLAFNKSTPL